MDLHFKLAFVISLIFILTKFFEMRFILKENKEMKLLLRETLVVYFSVVLGQFILNQLTPLSEMMVGGDAKAFTNKPNF